MRGVYGTHTIYLTNLSTAIHLINWQIITKSFCQPNLQNSGRYYSATALSLGSVCASIGSVTVITRSRKNTRLLLFRLIQSIENSLSIYFIIIQPCQRSTLIHITFLRRSQTKCECCALAFLKHTQVEFCLKSQLLNTNLTPSTQEHH